MAAKPPEKPSKTRLPRRIAVLLGAGGSSQYLLEQLQPLLDQDRDIEMQGVFVEEAAVQHAAELPFVQELCRVTFSVREFNSEHFERALALRMRTARQALDVLARRTGVQHSFRNVRGSALGLLQETAEASDITVFEPARLFNSAAGRPLARRHIVAVIDASEAGADVLRAALCLASGGSQFVSLLILPSADTTSQELQTMASELMPGRLLRTRVLENSDAVDLAAEVRDLGASMLVLPVSSELLDLVSLRQLRDQLRCPIFLVRRWGRQGAHSG